MLKIKKLFLVAISLMLMAILVSGCAGQEEKKAENTASQGEHQQHQQQGMNAGDMVSMMSQNPDIMMEAMSSPDARQSMTQMMSSEKMMPTMMDMMNNADMQKSMVKIMGAKETREAMIKIMSDPAMKQPMMEMMADPAMKDTFMSMMKDPKLMPMAKEAMEMK